MSFYQLLNDTIQGTDTTQGMVGSLSAFRPELVLCGLIVVLLFLRMLVPRWRMGPFWVTMLGAVWAFYLLAPWSFLSGSVASEATSQTTEIFTGVLISDGLSVFLRAILIGFVVLFTLFTQLSGIPEPEDATEFFVLVLGAVLGMCLMVSANHMLIVFLGMEMASVPSYVLAGILRGRRVGTEASLKYAVYGAGAAGVMLYGISLLCGALGTAHLPTMGTLLAGMIQSGLFEERAMVLTLGGLMLAVGVAFKLSAVPFHFWAPDVFEGATAEVAAMLSIVSKAAALGLLLRLVIGFGFVPDAAGLEALASVRHFMVLLIGTLAVVTCTFGNLAAYGQTNLKRLLAYSTIAHAGYMMMPVAAVAAMMGNDAVGASEAVAALLFYVTIYLFMNLGAFAFVAFLRNAAGDEELDTLAGLVRHSTGLVVVLSIVLFNLIGLPPFAGFTGKFTAFAAVWNAGLIWLVVVGVLNTALSLFYYLRIVKTMTLEEPAVDRQPVIIPLWSPQGIFCLAVMLPLLVWGIWWNGLYAWADAASAMLFR